MALVLHLPCARRRVAASRHVFNCNACNRPLLGAPPASGRAAGLCRQVLVLFPQVVFQIELAQLRGIAFGEREPGAQPCLQLLRRRPRADAAMGEQRQEVAHRVALQRRALAAHMARPALGVLAEHGEADLRAPGGGQVGAHGHAGQQAVAVAVAQVDEGAALLEGKSACDRELAKAHGNVGEYRLSEASAFFESMTQTFCTTFFYGNAATSPQAFTGLSPRFDDVASSVKDQIIDAGSSDTDNASIWLLVTGPQGVMGIYPKGTKAGITHIDVTKATGQADDGVDIGMYWDDADGKQFLALVDQFNLHCGLSVKDPRKVVRIGSIERSALAASGGVRLQMKMVEALERIDGLNAAGHQAAWVMDRQTRSFLRQQLLNDKNPYLAWEEHAGKKMLHFGEVPILRSDALAVNEAAI